MIPDPRVRSLQFVAERLHAAFMEDRCAADLDAELRDEPIELELWRRGRDSDLHPGELED